MKKNIKNRTNDIVSMELDFFNLMKLAQQKSTQEDLAVWTGALEEVRKAGADAEALLGSAVSSMAESSAKLGKAAVETGSDKLGKETLEKGLREGAEVIAEETAEKVAEKAVSSGVKTTLKNLPFIGVLFSGGATVKDLYDLVSGIIKMQQALSKANSIGVEIKDVFNPIKLGDLIEQNKENADNLVLLSKIAASARYIGSNLAGVIGNRIDFTKDLIMAAVDAGTFGAATAVDVFLSVFILFIKDWAAGKLAKGYDDNLNNIIDIINKKIGSLEDGAGENPAPAPSMV